MPEDKKTKIGPGQPEEAAPKKPGFPIKKYGLYGIIAIVVVAGAYLVTLKVVKPMMAGGGGVTETAPAKKGAAEPAHKKESKKSDKKEASEEGAEGNIRMIEDLIVNPSGTGGRRFLSTSIGFEMATAEASGLFEQREAIVRDALITILSSQSISELSDFQQRERLRKLIKVRIEKLLNAQEITGVYFTEFVLQ
jgi:flagellar FliL protein